VVGFVPAPVFDASQLEEIAERPLPSGYPALPDDATERYALCVAKIRAQGIAVEECAKMGVGVQGDSTPGRIRVLASLDSRTRLFVLIVRLGIGQ
jgi:hypothetical protein